MKRFYFIKYILLVIIFGLLLYPKFVYAKEKVEYKLTDNRFSVLEEKYNTNNIIYSDINNYVKKMDFPLETGEEVNSNSCEDVIGKSVVEFLQMIFNYIKILGPILVVLFSSIDFTRSILTSDEDNMKKTQKRFGIRLGCAIGIYFLPLIATLVINLIFGVSGSQLCGLN